MVRVGGLQYTCNPTAPMGKRIEDMRLDGKPIEASKTYKVAGWAPVAEEAAKAGNKPVWEVVEQWLRSKNGTVAARRVNMPKITGALPNAGYLAESA
jgi:sulfur-oxidizing protein SoxB